MLQTLLTDRFRLALRRETKDLRVYELVAAKGGPKVQPAQDSKSPDATTMQQFANRISIQISLPVLDDPAKPGAASGPPVPVVDKTGLRGIYQIRVDLKPELGVDMFTLWQRVLQDQLGLRLESKRANVEMLVVESAEKIPTSN